MTTPASGKAPAKDDEPAYQWTEEMAESVEKLLEHDEANTLCTLDECNTIRKVLLAPESDYWKLEKAKVNPRARQFAADAGYPRIVAILQARGRRRPCNFSGSVGSVAALTGVVQRSGAGHAGSPRRGRG